MTTKELARHVMAERGLNTTDTALLGRFTQRTGALLRCQKKAASCDRSQTPSTVGSIFGRSRSSAFCLDELHLLRMIGARGLAENL